MLAKALNALLAFPIPTNTSSSVPPVISIMLPKYVKDVTSSMPRLLIMICSLALLLILMVFVLSVLILSPSLGEITSSLVVFVCIWEWGMCQKCQIIGKIQIFKLVYKGTLNSWPSGPTGHFCPGYWRLSRSQWNLQSAVLHSSDCSTIMRRVIIWSAVHLDGLKPAWFYRSNLSTASLIRSRIIRFKTFPVVDRSIIPL